MLPSAADQFGEAGPSHHQNDRVPAAPRTRHRRSAAAARSLARAPPEPRAAPATRIRHAPPLRAVQEHHTLNGAPRVCLERQPEDQAVGHVVAERQTKLLRLGLLATQRASGIRQCVSTAAFRTRRRDIRPTSYRQDATGGSVELVYVDHGYTGEATAEAAAAEGISLHVLKLPEAKRGLSYCHGGAAHGQDRRRMPVGPMRI